MHSIDETTLSLPAQNDDIPLSVDESPVDPSHAGSPSLASRESLSSQHPPEILLEQSSQILTTHIAHEAARDAASHFRLVLKIPPTQHRRSLRLPVSPLTLEESEEVFHAPLSESESDHDGSGSSRSTDD